MNSINRNRLSALPPLTQQTRLSNLDPVIISSAPAISFDAQIQERKNNLIQQIQQLAAQILARTPAFEINLQQERISFPVSDNFYADLTLIKLRLIMNELINLNNSNNNS